MARVDALAHGDLLIAADHAFIASYGYLGIADIGNPLSISLPAGLALQGQYSPESMVFSGQHLYLAMPFVGLQFVDVRDPGQPVLKGVFEDSGFVASVADWGVYLLMGAAGVLVKIIDVSNPESP